MKNINLEKLEDRIEWSLEISPSDIPIEGNCLASGDDDADREAEEAIRSQLNSGNEAAWCDVTVKARLRGTSLEVWDDLGACSYSSEEELRKELLPEMKRNCVDLLRNELRTVSDILTALTEEDRS